MLVHTSETVRFRYFVDLLMEHRRPVMLVGSAGSGKTILINDKLSGEILCNCTTLGISQTTLHFWIHFVTVLQLGCNRAMKASLDCIKNENSKDWITQKCYFILFYFISKKYVCTNEVFGAFWESECKRSILILKRRLSIFHETALQCMYVHIYTWLGKYRLL